MILVSLQFLVNNHYVRGVSRSYSTNYFAHKGYVIKYQGDEVIEFINHSHGGCTIQLPQACREVAFDYDEGVLQLCKVVPIEF